MLGHGLQEREAHALESCANGWELKLLTHSLVVHGGGMLPCLVCGLTLEHNPKHLMEDDAELFNMGGLKHKTN